MRFDFCSSKSEFTFMNFLIKHFHPVKAFLYLYDHFGFLYETVGFCSHSVSFFLNFFYPCAAHFNLWLERCSFRKLLNTYSLWEWHGWWIFKAYKCLQVSLDIRIQTSLLKIQECATRMTDETLAKCVPELKRVKTIQSNVRPQVYLAPMAWERGSDRGSSPASCPDDGSTSPPQRPHTAPASSHTEQHTHIFMWSKLIPLPCTSILLGGVK